MDFDNPLDVQLDSMTGNPNATMESYDIRIAADGSWWHEGRRIGRMGLVKLFASVLHRDAEGRFWLITPAERGQIVVEDAPFIAVEMQVEGQGPDQTLRFRTNLDDWVTADRAHPLRFDGDSRIYVEIRGGMEALVARSVYYDLAELALQHGGIWSAGVFFKLSES
jgi:hypothetical protein